MMQKKRILFCCLYIVNRTFSGIITCIIPFCKHVMAKVILVPCFVKRDSVGHGEVTINNAMIITTRRWVKRTVMDLSKPRSLRFYARIAKERFPMMCLTSSNGLSIRKTCPLKPHSYIAKLGYAGVYLFFLFLLQNIYCGYSVRTASERRF